ncbi:MAG: GH92 family glycosyl hydrolase [Capnocytophaga sp.]|nr:GH92 family glycosyl hydrolase [Capnocytophaga sp.]
MKKIVFIAVLCTQFLFGQKTPADYVNPFIGTSNFGATHPGAIHPRGMFSISPFNVAFDTKGISNPLEKDSRWLSNPYVNENTFLTGFTQANMSGVGCPELGVILAMPTTGELKINHLEYGTTYKNEKASAGYYSVELDKYNVKVEATASIRSGISRYSFPKGDANILINLGLGLTNEQGAMLKIVSPTEIEGLRMVGSFCYNSPEKAYPLYFVAKVSEVPNNYGIWQTHEKYDGVEAQWMLYNGKTRFKEKFSREVVGDSIGAYFRYHFDKPTQVELRVGISYVSIENARENLEKEIKNNNFNQVYAQTKQNWNDLLSVASVKGENEDKKTIFYTALYHTLIHPNILNDYNGQYPKAGEGQVGTTPSNTTRYTTFSLWDTYRNYHQLMSLLYPEQQLNMVKSMLEIYDESGWLPKWELNSTETFTMVGDPASIVLADTYLRGLTNFDVQKAYKAMLKGAEVLKNNPIRPGLEEYLKKGYLSVESGIAGPVSTTQEYNIADFAIAQLGEKIGANSSQNKKFRKQSVSYRAFFNPKWNLLQPKLENGAWYEPFNPDSGANFEHNVGYIEGNAWQYAFMVSHDVNFLIKAMKGEKNFVKNLNHIFESNQFDMANEPDMGYPYLFSFVKGNEWQTQKYVDELLLKHFRNTPDGLPGNDDTGTMSAWAVYSMMGFYPIVPAEPMYVLTSPKFTEITLHLDKKYYPQGEITIKSNASEQNKYIKKIFIDGKEHKSFFITDEMLKKIKEIRFELSDKP